MRKDGTRPQASRRIHTTRLRNAAVNFGMRNREAIYDAGMRAAEPLASLLAGMHPKGAAAVNGRKASALVFDQWAAAARDASRPLFLVHAPSVGESLMAQAIIEQLRMLAPDAQVAFTFFSPSAERIAARVGADVCGYLPIDSRPRMSSFVRALRPDVVAFVRTEIWPMLGIEAARAGSRVAFVNAVLGATSSRLRGPARYLLGPAYRRLNAIGAVTARDAERFEMLGVSDDRVFVTGDARFDQVWQRVQSIDRGAPLLSAVRDARGVLVAGSTWPADEGVLIPALLDVPAESRPRLVIAPHEPTPAHIAALSEKLGSRELSVALLGDAEKGGGTNSDVIIVDRVGVLADLYAAADIAYVGGGFGTNGLHSVIEPAALGVPVLYGPRHGNTAEAGDLAEARGGFVVADEGSLAAEIWGLMRDATVRRLAGTAAAGFVQSRLGGAHANAALLSGLMTVL
jgi:3-deoxy-D-manno-octulosonic-acid transferase